MTRLSDSLEGSEIVGFDTGFFAASYSGAGVLPEIVCQSQMFGDIRNIDLEFLAQFDAFVLLAAISNDPMGDRFSDVTYQINLDANMRILTAIAKMRNKRVVFASSCSMYGAAGAAAKVEEDELNPLTAYAKSKVGVEKFLEALSSGDNLYTSLRFSTACGVSDRVRLDLVLNDFVTSALQTGIIEILSDGQAWRPLISVSDMASAIEWGLTRSVANGGRYIAINVGSDDWNYQIHDLAAHVATEIPSTKISVNDSNPADQRSYRVNFAKFRELAPNHQPQSALPGVINNLADCVEGILANMNGTFRESEFIRLKALERLLFKGQLDEQLSWQKNLH